MRWKVLNITGMGCICSAGTNLLEVTESLYKGKRFPKHPERIHANLEYSYPVFEVPSDLEGMDREATRTVKLTLCAVQEALEQASLDSLDLRKFKVGIAVGTTVGCTLNNEPFYRDYRAELYPGMEAVSRYLENNPAVYIARKFKLRGPVATVANACSSGSDAIGLAKYWLENDICDLAIAGGADELSRVTYLGFISLLISSSRGCRPFDKKRDGLNLGEGAGIIILEKEKTSRTRGIKPLARLLGYGTFADAYHPTAPHPEGRGLRRAIEYALKQGDIQPEEVGFINAHGTSTVNNDKVEGVVIADFFSDRIPIVSDKAYTGHTLGAAGAIEAVLTVQALLDQKLPKTLGFEESDEECRIEPTTRLTAIDAEFGLSNSLAFGGNNSTLLIGRAV
jgi:3-oxoacyl-[acyl-carrier-protein] synthase II